MKRKISFLMLMVTLLFVSKESYSFFGGIFKKNEEKIVLGFLPNEGSQEWDGYRDGLARELEIAIGKKVEVKTADSYEALIDAVLAGEIEIAFSGANQYVVAKDDILGGENIKALLTYGPQGAPGNAGYYGYIATKKGSDLAKAIQNSGAGDDMTPGSEDERKRLSYLEGKRFGFVSYSSTSGFKVPRSILYDTFGPKGFNLVEEKDDFANPKKIDFMDITVSATSDHQGSMNAIYTGAVDAGAFCCDYFGNKGVDAKSIEDYYVIAKRIVPNGPIWANLNSLGSENAQKIVEHFEGLTPENASPQGRVMWGGEARYMEDDTYRFIGIDDSFYSLIREL